MMKSQVSLLDLRLSQSQTAIFSSLSNAGAVESLSPETADLGITFIAFDLPIEPVKQAELLAQLTAHEYIQHIVRAASIDEIYQAFLAHPNAVLLTSVQGIKKLALSFRQQITTVVVGASNPEAMEAFELRAKGFLSYPIKHSELANCIARIFVEHQQLLERLRNSRITQKLCEQFECDLQDIESKMRLMSPNCQYSTLNIRSNHGLVALQRCSVKWVEAAGDYMCIHTDEDTHVVRVTLTDLVKQLGEDNFLHASRSVIVNAERVTGHRKDKVNRTYLIIDKDTEIKVSQRCFAAIWARLV